MSAHRENDQGRWVPAEPMPEPFGVRWERAWRHRRNNGHGQGRLRSLIGGWRDTRAVDKLSRGAGS